MANKTMLGQELIDILGLPDHIYRFGIVFQAGQPPIVKCEYRLDLADDEILGFKRAFKKYQLVETDSVEEGDEQTDNDGKV